MKKFLATKLKSWLRWNLSRNDLAACLASGILLAAAYPPWNLSAAIFFALVPLWWRLRPGWRWDNAWLGFLTGFVFYALHLFWLRLVAPPGLALLVVFLSLIFGAQAAVAGFLSSYSFSIPACAALWALVEYLRSLGVLSFAWGYMGHALYLCDSLRPYAYDFGVSGLSFFLAGVNFSLAAMIVYWTKRWTNRRLSFLSRECCLPPHFFFTAFFGCAMIGIVFSPSSTEQNSAALSSSLRIALIQGGVEQEEKESESGGDALERYLKLSADALSFKPDLIVWPESAIVFPLNYETDLLKQILDFIKQADVELFAGTVYAEYDEKEKWKYWNRAVLLSPDTNLDLAEYPVKMDKVPSYDKMHLVPYGEWIPLGEYWPFYHIETLIEEAGAGLFQRGENLTIFSTRQGAAFAAAICFESTLAGQMREARRKGADFFINITNDAWFERSAGLEQHFLQSAFRAAENRCYLARAANTGITGVIGPTGKVLKTLPTQEPGVCTFELPFAAKGKENPGLVSYRSRVQ
ncbi:MAG: apolipoprotein N-acyltransferase [Candidatus Omnitrophota bacterium]